MDALNRSTTTRPLALAAMLLVAGVLFLRAFHLANAPFDRAPIGSADEQRLTALIEPVIGANRVRTSIQRRSSGEKHWLILIDGPATEDASTSAYHPLILNLIAARGFQTGTDTVEIIQRPFANTITSGMGPLTQLEFGGLGLTLFILLLISAGRSSSEALSRQGQSDIPARLSDNPERQAENDNSNRKVAALANAAPERSVALIRRWMEEDKQ
ncbi:MAG: hypothetical protein AAGH90_10625 [Pseudomonadota bacterium]